MYILRINRYKSKLGGKGYRKRKMLRKSESEKAFGDNQGREGSLNYKSAEPSSLTPEGAALCWCSRSSLPIYQPEHIFLCIADFMV